MKSYIWPTLVCVLVAGSIWLFEKTIYLDTITDPPPAYMVKNFEKQIGCAERIGFKTRLPILRVMKESPGWNEPQGWAYNVWPNSLIILAPYASYQTMAHEIGHVVDFQTRRKGHPDFERLQHVPTEYFADVIGDKILIECQKPKNRN